MRRPILIVDGDSFAHRAYHALPKSIRRRGNKGGGAILDFANILLRLYDVEKPRAVLVGWDTYDAPTYRHEALESYQSGRSFDDELLEQFEVLPNFVKASDLLRPKAPATKQTIFWRRR
jgi:DNA polymerase-1